MFNGYLSVTERTELTDAAIQSGLIDEIPRMLLLDGIPPGYRLGLKRANNPLDQFLIDLASINGVERLEGGLVPLSTYLHNFGTQLRLRRLPQSQIFERLAGLVAAHADGVPALPDPQALPEVIRNEAIFGTDDTVSIQFLADGTRTGRSVGRIVVPRFENGSPVMINIGTPWTMVGTGWMIAPSLAITNRHVLQARRSGEGEAAPADVALQSRHSWLEFDYDMPGDISPAVKVVAAEAMSAELDYAILRLEAAAGPPPLPLYPELIRTEQTTQMAVNIIQHPRGNPKRVAFRNNLVSGADERTIRYFTDTDFGSSGSPVCDDSWRVVALHRGARQVDRVQYQGRSVAFVNFGSQIATVLADIKRTNHALYEEIAS